jgi:hypothetical protein
MRGSYRIIYTQIRPRPVVLLWPSGNLTFCLLETLGSNPDAAQLHVDVQKKLKVGNMGGSLSKKMKSVPQNA